VILVTGASGFVGAHFCRTFPSVPLQESSSAPDLREPHALRLALQDLRFDAVLHLAAQSSVADSFSNPGSTYEINFLGTANLLETLNAGGFAGPFLLVSTGEVYGSVTPSRAKLQEGAALRPASPYAVSKLAAEFLCLQWSLTSKIRAMVARPFVQIGPGQADRFVISSFARQIAEIKLGKIAPRIQAGNLSVIRDFLDVRDAVRAYETLLRKEPAGVFNVCSGTPRRLADVLEQMLKIAGIRAMIEEDKNRMRPFDPPELVGDPENLGAATGWAPKIPFETTLADIISYWEKQLSA
jgi:GDP-4-dehydro-6-deoxy-D-mannose reductase